MVEKVCRGEILQICGAAIYGYNLFELMYLLDFHIRISILDQSVKRPIEEKKVSSAKSVGSLQLR